MKMLAQRGSGVGGILRGVYKRALPWLKKAGKVAGREALEAGMNILNDVSRDDIPIKDSIRKRVRESGRNLKRKAEVKLDRLLTGSGYKIPHKVLMKHSLADIGAARTLALEDRKIIKKKGRKNNIAEKKTIKKHKKNKKISNNVSTDIFTG